MLNDPIRFLVIAGFPRSLITFRGAFLQALLDAGVETHVASPGLAEDHVSRKKLEDMGVKVHEVELKRTGMNPVEDFKTFWCLLGLMKTIEPDYMLAYTIKPVIYGMLAAKVVRVPKRIALITGLGYSFQENGKNTGLLQYLVRKLYALSMRCAHLTFFQNPDDERLFRTLALLPQQTRSVVVNGSGVSLSHFDLAALPAEPRFLLIGRLLADKGVREYIEAARQIKASYPEAMFYLVGWIDENPNAISQTELDEWIDSGVIDYLGKLDDVRSAIASSNVFVLPSYREGTPRTVLEAMAMGRPIITTDAPGCRETVIEGENGFLVPVKCVNALVVAMKRFVLKPELIVRMGMRSRELAVEKYDVNKVNALMLKEIGIDD